MAVPKARATGVQIGAILSAASCAFADSTSFLQGDRAFAQRADGEGCRRPGNFRAWARLRQSDYRSSLVPWRSRARADHCCDGTEYRREVAANLAPIVLLERVERFGRRARG